MFWNYLFMGCEHVLPLGFDHILFILALFFLNSELKTAIVQCSIFTLAHSITLALYALGYINFNTKIIEIIIAFSIFVVAFENIFQSKLKPWRVFLVFIFGLIHGIGFATVLKNIGLPKNEIITALIGFNCGVEIAQILIILFCYFFIAKLFKEKVWYQTKFTQPLSLILSCIALFWIIQRI